MEYCLLNKTFVKLISNNLFLGRVGREKSTNFCINASEIGKEAAACALAHCIDINLTCINFNESTNFIARAKLTHSCIYNVSSLEVDDCFFPKYCLYKSQNWNKCLLNMNAYLYNSSL